MGVSLYKLGHWGKQLLGTEAGRLRMRYEGDVRTCRRGTNVAGCRGALLPTKPAGPEASAKDRRLRRRMCIHGDRS